MLLILPKPPQLILIPLQLLKQSLPYFVIGRLRKPNLRRERCTDDLEYRGGQ